MTDNLKPCPFCKRCLTKTNGRMNVVARCNTEGCWMADRKMTVPLDDQTQVDQWNTRAADALEPSGDVVERVVERVAERLCEHDDAKWDAQSFNETPSGETPEEMRDRYRSLAKAAIAALGASHAE